LALWQLTPVILATQEAEIRRILVGGHPGEIVFETYLEKLFTKIGWVNCFKAKALSSNPSTKTKPNQNNSNKKTPAIL
jgi:hypothetical protein